MKKIIARALVLLMVMNLGWSNRSYADYQFPDPIIENTTATEATFKYSSTTSGTLHYIVTPQSVSGLTGEQIKALAQSGVINPELIAKGSVSVGAETTNTINISGLRDRHYKLHSVFEVSNVLHAPIVKEFTALAFEVAPAVVYRQTDKLVINSKFNSTGELYYGVYTDATGVTANDVVNDQANAYKIYTNHQTVVSGTAITTLIGGLKGNTSYDLVFVKKDMFGNISQSVQTLNDQYTRGNRLLNAVFTKGANPYDETDDRIYLYFKEPVDDPGDGSNYTIHFDDQSDANAPGQTLDGTGLYPEFTVIGATGNRVEIQFESWAYENGFSNNFYSGEMQVTVHNGGTFEPAMEPDHNATVFTVPYGLMSGYNQVPLMSLAEYKYLPQDGPDGDMISVTLDGYTYTSPSAIDFSVTFGTSTSSMMLALVPNDDFIVDPKEDMTGFDIVFTSAGAVKLENLPTGFFNITRVDPQTPPTFNPFASTIFAMRNSSVSTLSSLDLFGKNVHNFAPGTYTYNETVPHGILEKYGGYAAAGVNGMPTSAESYTFVVGIGNNITKVEVVAADGTISDYTINTTANELTIGGLAVNGAKVVNFDPYLTTHNVTISESITPVPTLTVVHAPGVTATVTYALSTSQANTYVYTVVLSKDSAQATFIVNVTGAAGTVTPDNPTEDRDDGSDTPTGGTTGGTTGTATGGTTGTNTTVANPAALIEQLMQQAANMTPTNIAASMDQANNALNSIQNDQQAFSTLTNVNTMVKQAAETMAAAPTETAQITQKITEMTTKVEQKINMIENPENRLTVLSQLMTEIKIVKGLTNTITPTMDKSIEDMVQKTADAFGTVKVTAPVGDAPVKLDAQALQTVINKQAEAMTRLTQIQQTFFDTTVARTIKKDIKIEIAMPADAPSLKVDLATDQVNLLREARVDTLSVSNVNAEIKMPMANLNTTQPMQLVIDKMAPVQAPNPAGSANANEPKLVYDIAFLVGNERQEKFSKPVTLSFNLTTFGLEQESGLELAIFKLNTQTNVWEPVGGIVDPETAKIFVTRDNLSQYTVLKSKKSFSDADQSWAKAEINAMLNKGIVSDTANFQPQSVLTRGEFAKWIAKAYGLKVSDASLPFKDVAKNGEAYEAIAAVYQQGLLSGKSKTSFDPNAAVTQNELAAAMGKLLVSFDNKEKSGKVTSKYLSQLKTTQVASWAEDDMALLMELGLNTSAKAGKDPITKEAAAAAFMKFYRS